MIIIKVTKETKRFIEKNINNNLKMYDIKYYPKHITLKIHKEDLDKIKKLNYYSKIELVKYLGKKGVIKHLKIYYYDYIILITFIFLLYFISNIIINVEIKHENKFLKEEIKKILKKDDIKILTTAKSMDKLNDISDKIIYKNKDIIDWLSINREGMKYVVSFEERIIKEEEPKEKYCHIIANNNATITRIITKSGINMFNKGDSVHPGEIIVSGIVTLNEKIKNYICADGKVYGEVWYKVAITKPLTYEEKQYTQKERYNFIYNGNYLYKKNYKYYDEKLIKKINNLKIIKQKEYKIIKKKLSIEEARIIAINEAKNKILKELDENSTIIEEKVLKESKNNSKIELEVFISVEQLISKKINYEAGEFDDTGKSIQYSN